MARHFVSTLVKTGFCTAFAFALAIPGASAQTKQPLKVAVIETLSGAQAATGSLFVTAAQYAVEKINSGGGYNDQPIQLLTYDSQGTPTGASARVATAIGDGANIIVQGASSAIAGQITEDVRRHNLRNPTQPIVFINTAAEARDLTGDKCHFYHFKFALDAEMRLRAIAQTIKGGSIKVANVFSINQNYSWGVDMENAIKSQAEFGGYKVTDTVLHDVNRIQDFTPYVTRIAGSNADTVITGNWGTDLIRLMRATSDAKLKVRIISMFLDGPGNITSLGDAAEGQLFIDVFNAEANGDRGMALQSDFIEKTKSPALVNSHARTILGVLFLGEALKNAPAGGTIDVQKIALAMEKTKFNSPAGMITMRADDHQALVPISISEVSKAAKTKVENSPFGFKPLQKVEGADAITPPQASCKMQRPT